MAWASHAIDRLKAGETVTIRPRGHSMSPKVKSGQRCLVGPVEAADLSVGDIVLCKVAGSQYLHLVKAIQGDRFQIGNNRGRINGWVGKHSVYGRLIRVLDDAAV